MKLNPRRNQSEEGISSAIPPWKQFEHNVRDALELAGYQVNHDRILAGGQTDLIACQRVGPVTTRVVVECKFSETNRPVSVDEVENFAARVLLLRNSDTADHGLLVSNVGFTRYAYKAGGQSYVELVTLNELYRRIFDFGPYVTGMHFDFQNSPLSTTFIRPYMAEMSLTVSTDESDSILVTRTPSKTPIDIAAFCDDWLQEPGGGRLCLLGDYGTGKTTFCTWYANRQAERYLAKPNTERTPLLISLHRYHKALDVRAMITDFLVNDCGIRNLRLAAFQALLERGHFVIVLDGFDEMARYVDREVRYRTIAELGWLARGESKVILTGRSSYFPTHEELVQVLGSPESEDIYNAARSALDELVDYRLYETLPFSGDQIKEFVHRHSGNSREADQIWRYIVDTYNLLDLASRPVLLDMIVKSLPRLITIGQKSIINASKLYDIYTGAWIDREARKGEFRKLIRQEHKLKFIEELAFQLFAEDRTSISYRQLGQPIRSFFEISDIDDVDFFSHDIRTCSFLHRTTNAGYVFIHRSFQEFFVAKKLLADVRRIDNIAWASRLLPPEIIRFASELLIDSDPIVVNHLVKWAQQSPASVLGSNCVSVISISGKQILLDVADAYGLAPDLLASAAAYQNGDEIKGNLFVEFVYRTALKRVAEYVARSQIQEELDQGDIDFIYDAVHDEFFSIITTLRGHPLPTSKDVDIFITHTCTAPLLSSGWQLSPVAQVVLPFKLPGWLVA